MLLLGPKSGYFIRNDKKIIREVRIKTKG